MWEIFARPTQTHKAGDRFGYNSFQPFPHYSPCQIHRGRFHWWHAKSTYFRGSRFYSCIIGQIIHSRMTLITSVAKSANFTLNPFAYTTVKQSKIFYCPSTLQNFPAWANVFAHKPPDQCPLNFYLSVLGVAYCVAHSPSSLSIATAYVTYQPRSHFFQFLQCHNGAASLALFMFSMVARKACNTSTKTR
jgi:hypothetical protein